MVERSILDVLGASPIVPVLTFDSTQAASSVCGALVRAGLKTLEVTLRTPAALDVVRHLRAAFPHVQLGVGTVTRAEQLPPLVELEVDFVVTPGLTPSLADGLEASPIPALPGVATPSEAMAAWERGFGCVKLFPARTVGGIAALKAIAAVLPGMRFCPTGGIGREEFAAYLALDCVVAVGGSWLADPGLVVAGDLEAIERRAREDLGAACRRP